MHLSKQYLKRVCAGIAPLIYSFNIFAQQKGTKKERRLGEGKKRSKEKRQKGRITVLKEGRKDKKNRPTKKERANRKTRKKGNSVKEIKKEERDKKDRQKRYEEIK